METAKPKRRGFDTGQEQMVGGKQYDPRNQWGSGPFPGMTTKFTDLPFGGYFMSGEQIAKAGPNYDPAYYSSGGGRAGGEMPRRMEDLNLPIGKDPQSGVIARIVQGLEDSTKAQTSLLARYAPKRR